MSQYVLLSSIWPLLEFLALCSQSVLHGEKNKSDGDVQNLLFKPVAASLRKHILKERLVMFSPFPEAALSQLDPIFIVLRT